MAKLILEPEHKKYRVDWDGNESYDVVCLHIRTVKPIKVVKDGKLMLIADNIKESYSIYRSGNRNMVEMERPNATYEFSLRSKETGEIIDCQEEYWGLKEKMYVRCEEETDRMGRVYVTCPIRVSEELFWLMFRDDYADLRFFLPPMEEGDGEYRTSCLVWKEMYDRLKLGLDEKISDYFAI